MSKREVVARMRTSAADLTKKASSYATKEEKQLARDLAKDIAAAADDIARNGLKGS